MRLSKPLLIALGAIAALLLLPGIAFAQCAVCRSALVNSPEGQQLVGGFNSGILFLLSAPFAITGVVALLILKPGPAAVWAATLWPRIRGAARVVAPALLSGEMPSANQPRAGQQATTPSTCSRSLPVRQPAVAHSEAVAAERARKQTCKACSASLSERHIVLRKAGDNERPESVLAFYRCPACGLQWEAAPEPDDLRVWEMLAAGAALQTQGRFQDALVCFERVLAINGSSAMGWYNRGCVLGNVGGWEEAVRSYNRALEIDPDDGDAWHNKAQALRALRQFPAALECYRRALSLNPRRAATWVRMGDLLLVLNLPEEAQHCYERALRLQPRNAMAWLGKGCARGQLRRMEEALQCFDHALGMSPENAEAWSHKGNALCALGRFAEAMHCYERALAIAPRQPTAVRNRRVLSRAFRRVQ